MQGGQVLVRASVTIEGLKALCGAGRLRHLFFFGGTRQESARRVMCMNEHMARLAGGRYQYGDG